MRVYPVSEQQAGEYDGKESEEEIAEQANAHGIPARQPAEDPHQLTPIEQDHRGDRTHLDDHDVGINCELPSQGNPGRVLFALSLVPKELALGVAQGCLGVQPERPAGNDEVTR